MRKLAAEGAEVYVLIATRGYPPLFSEGEVATARQEALAAHRVLGVKDTLFLSFPAAGLDTVPHRKLTAKLVECFQQIRADMVFAPFGGDLHSDHQQLFLSCLVAARPSESSSPRAIYAYETVSETHWNAPYLAPNFTPNLFVDITEHLEAKCRAAQTYASQVKTFPHARSVEALRALARCRGATVGVEAAEGFVVVRQLGC
jgi:LmbE family N-acetylglucosaminyl deacetylase